MSSSYSASAGKPGTLQSEGCPNPVAQMAQLRMGKAWSDKDLTVECDEATPLRGVSGAALDIELILQRCAQLVTESPVPAESLQGLGLKGPIGAPSHPQPLQRTGKVRFSKRLVEPGQGIGLTDLSLPPRRRGSATSAGILFRSWNAGGEGSAAIVFDWERGVLEAIFEGAGADLGAEPELDPDDEATRRVGGPTEHAGDADVHLRVLLDHSALEVYIGSGEVLSTRIYRCAGLLILPALQGFRSA